MTTAAEVLDAVREVTDAANEKRKWDALSPSVSDLERRVQRLFRSQARDVKAAVATFQSRWPVREATVPHRMSEFIERVLRKRRGQDAERLRPPLAAAMRAALKTVAVARYGISFELEDVRATAYMKARGAELVRELNATTVADLRAILSKGIEEGWSYDRVAKAITAKYASYGAPRPQKWLRTRAHLIAVTENAVAYEHAHLEMARALERSGLPMLKEWGVAGDERSCETCMGNGGEGPVPLEQSFASGDAMPPAHPACRCWSEVYLDPAATAPDAVTVNGRTVELTL
jgi:hypothetical protein